MLYDVAFGRGLGLPVFRLAPLLLFLLSSTLRAQEEVKVIDFFSMPDTVTTPIPSWPVTFAVPQTTSRVTVNERAVPFDSLGLDVFYAFDLSPGPNEIRVAIEDSNGDTTSRSKVVNYDPTMSTAHLELLYVNCAHYVPQPDGSTWAEVSVLVIDPVHDSFFGLLRQAWARAISPDGKLLVLRSSAEPNPPNFGDGALLDTTTQTLLDTPLGGTVWPASSDAVLFGPSTGLAYFGVNVIDTSTNRPYGAPTLLPCALGDQAAISANESTLYSRGGYIDVSNPLSPSCVSVPYPGFYTMELAPNGLLWLSTYSWARGTILLVDPSSGEVRTSLGQGDYTGDVVFPSASTAVAGCYGNTWFGGGGLTVFDLESLGATSSLYLPGARSLALSGDKATLYASVFYTFRSGHYEGTPSLRGVAQLSATPPLQVSKVFFVSLLSTMLEPYYGSDNIFVKKPCEVCPEGLFRRGDAISDGSLNISDAISILGYLFLGGASPACLDVADLDDDGVVSLTDPINLLNYLFLGGTLPQEPFVCATDKTEDSFTCSTDLCQ